METAKLQNSKNLILNFLSNEEFEEISPKLERVKMTLGDIINSPQEKIRRVYFPETGVVSVVTLLENGMGVESGIIGREGISGASVVLTDKEAFSEATVQLSGESLAMNVFDFREFFETNQKFRQVILKYIHAFISQISQNAACLSYHTIEKRLARWLLMFQDRSGRAKMEMTQEFISQMLGVHRPSVSKSANKLQKLGFIEYNRGVIEILNRSGLEEFSCECYRTINRALSRYISF